MLFLYVDTFNHDPLACHLYSLDFAAIPEDLGSLAFFCKPRCGPLGAAPFEILGGGAQPLPAMQYDLPEDDVG